MQIYALDHSSCLIHARSAHRGMRYTCPECQGEVRMRGGAARQPHFYHLAATTCLLHGKSLTHLQVQLALQQMLSPEDAQLERRFPEIGRIADVVWTSQKLVFEIQLSPIHPAEIQMRNRDYAQAGYRVIWILHDSRYNRSRITAAEIALRFSPHYFTNINALGKGIFYDQYATVHFKRRKERSPRFPVQFNCFFPVNLKQLPRHFPETRKKWPFSFAGDLFQQSLEWEGAKKGRWIQAAFGLFRSLHYYLLEKTTS